MRDPYESNESGSGSRAAESVAEAGRAAADAAEYGDVEGGGIGEKAREQVAEKATMVKERAEETADPARETGADQLDNAAESLRDRAESMGGMQGKVGTSVADGMEKTAGYLREKDTQAMMADAERFVREHPTQAVLGAVAVGFIVGRMLR
ncbi:MAG TPA: hypothetical protein VMR52_05630 [Dehalococcoidia bacterium]|nr:hypothetical protein [Dehalococcoidia bacterium]